ncbi:hypothetical protein EJB05_41976, partial [Eragrostis curvula]
MNTTLLAAASFFRSGYRIPLPAAVPRKHGTPSPAAGVGDRGGGDEACGSAAATAAAERSERAMILESRSRARAPGRRKRCGLTPPRWRSSARGAAGRRAGERRRRSIGRRGGADAWRAGSGAGGRFGIERGFGGGDLGEEGSGDFMVAGGVARWRETKTRRGGKTMNRMEGDPEKGGEGGVRVTTRSANNGKGKGNAQRCNARRIIKLLAMVEEVTLSSSVYYTALRSFSSVLVILLASVYRAQAL